MGPLDKAKAAVAVTGTIVGAFTNPVMPADVASARFTDINNQSRQTTILNRNENNSSDSSDE